MQSGYIHLTVYPRCTTTQQLEKEARLPNSTYKKLAV